MKSDALRKRQERFSRLLHGSDPQAPGSCMLYAHHSIDHALYSVFLDRVEQYVRRSIDESTKYNKLGIQALLEQLGVAGIDALTPGGVLVPKRNTVLEYNIVVRTFAEIVESLIPETLIGSWHVPPNVRIKFGTPTPGVMDRPRPTERPHSDAWAGEHPDSVTVHIPVFGDLFHNYLAIYAPPDDFEEGWLEPVDSTDPAVIREYEYGFLHKYQRLPFSTRPGHACFIDAAMLHASERLPHCGLRVSVEAPFVWSTARALPALKREAEHAPHVVLRRAGEAGMFYFPDHPGQIRDNAGSFRHPSGLALLDLELSSYNNYQASLNLQLRQSSVERMQFMRHRIVDLVQEGRRNLAVLEIGSYEGESAISWSRSLAALCGGGTVLCVDPWKPYHSEREVVDEDSFSRMDKDLASGAVFERFQNNIRQAPASAPISYFRGTLADIPQSLVAGGFDLVYIDGDHRYSSVKEDIRRSLALLHPRGYLCGDDLEIELLQGSSEESYARAHQDNDTGQHLGVSLAVMELLGKVDLRYRGAWAVRV